MIKKKISKFAAFTTVFGMITVGAFVGHTNNEVEKNKAGVQKAEETIMSKCFETEWMASELDETQTNGLTKAQVLELLRSSKMTIEFEMYRSWKNTVGYTYASTKRIWMNRKYHDGMSACEKASNTTHELLHKLGQTHDVAATARRPFSSNYMANKIIKKCCV